MRGPNRRRGAAHRASGRHLATGARHAVESPGVPPTRLNTVRLTSPPRRLTWALTLGVWLAGGSIAAQDTPSTKDESATIQVDSASLKRIRTALDTPPVLALPTDPLRFYQQITATRPTWADYMRGSGRWFEITAISAPSRNGLSRGIPAGSGIDLSALFRRVEKALNERTVRQIRQQIDRELEVIAGTPPGAAPSPPTP